MFVGGVSDYTHFSRFSFKTTTKFNSQRFKLSINLLLICCNLGKLNSKQVEY